MGDRSEPATEPVAVMQAAASPRAQAPPPSTFWQRTFAALHHRNYRLWFQGQLVSMVGTWMQVTAQGFLVFQLTHSTAYWVTSALPPAFRRFCSCCLAA